MFSFDLSFYCLCGPGIYTSFICLILHDIIMNAKPNIVGLSESPSKIPHSIKISLDNIFSFPLETCKIVLHVDIAFLSHVIIQLGTLRYSSICILNSCYNESEAFFTSVHATVKFLLYNLTSFAIYLSNSIASFAPKVPSNVPSFSDGLILFLNM